MPRSLLDRRQRDVHDRVVEHDHEQPERDGDERPPLPVLGQRRCVLCTGPPQVSQTLAQPKRCRTTPGTRHPSSSSSQRHAPDAAPRRADYHELHRDLGRGAGALLAGRRRRPRDRVLAAVGDASSTHRAAPEWATWFNGGRVNVARVCLHRWARRRRGAASASSGEDGSRESLTFAELSRQVTPARRGARRARRRAQETASRSTCRCRPAVAVAVARVRAHRRGAGPDLLRLRRAGDRAAARRTPRPRSRSAPTGRCAAASGSTMRATLDEAGATHGARARDRVEPRDAARGPRSCAAARHAARRSRSTRSTPYLLAYTSGTTGRPKGALHVHGGFLVSVAREAAYQSDVKRGDRIHFATDMGWIMGPVDGRRRRRRRRDGRLRRGGAGLAGRPALAPGRGGAGDDARRSRRRSCARSSRTATRRRISRRCRRSARPASRGTPTRTAGSSRRSAAAARRS